VFLGYCEGIKAYQVLGYCEGIKAYQVLGYCERTKAYRLMMCVKIKRIVKSRDVVFLEGTEKKKVFIIIDPFCMIKI
jgi:hypothetical protein